MSKYLRERSTTSLSCVRDAAFITTLWSQEDDRTQNVHPTPPVVVTSKRKESRPKISDAKHLHTSSYLYLRLRFGSAVVASTLGDMSVRKRSSSRINLKSRVRLIGSSVAAVGSGVRNVLMQGRKKEEVSRACPPITFNCSKESLSIRIMLVTRSSLGNQRQAYMGSNTSRKLNKSHRNEDSYPTRPVSAVFGASIIHRRSLLLVFRRVLLLRYRSCVFNRSKVVRSFSSRSCANAQFVTSRSHPFIPSSALEERILRMRVHLNTDADCKTDTQLRRTDRLFRSLLLVETTAFLSTPRRRTVGR